MKKTKVIARQATKIEELEQALHDAQQDMILFNRQQQVGQHGLEAVIEEQKRELTEASVMFHKSETDYFAAKREIEALNGVIKNLRERLDKYMYWISADLQLQPVGDVIYRLKDESGEIVYSTDPNNPEMTVTHYLILTDPTEAQS